MSINTLFRNEIVHAASAVFVTGVYYFYSHNILLSVLLFIAATAIDVDHLIDYAIYLVSQNKRLNLQFFLSGKFFGITNKLYVFFHMWELVPIFLALYFLGKGTVFLPIALGLATHYFVDTFTNHMHPLAYVFLFRALNRFELNKLSHR